MELKRGYLVLSVILVIFISGCVQQLNESGQTETTETPQEESPPIEGEASNPTDVTPPQQDVTVTQPAIPETKVQEPKCSREFSPQFNAEPYYSGPLFDAHFHMPNLIDVSKIGGYGEGQDADH